MNKTINDFNLVVTEYPKSGGTWLTSLIGAALCIPMRDLYITQERIDDRNNSFYKGILDHPWYKDITHGVNLIMPCVVKSHELPHSPLLDFNAKYIHLFRDGRDIAVSRYFFEKEFCVKNGLTQNFDMSFEDMLVKVATEWKIYVKAWMNEDALFLRYEDLLTDTKLALVSLLNQCNVTYQDSQLDFAIADNVKDKMSSKLSAVYSHNTFVRKGIAGDWKNHFTASHCEIFDAIAGDLLKELGYA
ncbi:MAG: sulfotransferase domain-containing protein [Gammaproteobacteria bacterium]|nr:sulfotransferase domain-containing protein [Gammaproteobacteria bacterium]